MKIRLAPLAVGLCACSPVFPGQAPACGPERAHLDGVCVSQRVADYVSCVRAQGAQLSADRRAQLSIEAGNVGVRAAAVTDLKDTLERKYAASDANVLEIIRGCNGIAGPGSVAASPVAAAGPGKAEGRSCLDVLKRGASRGDGLYWIQPPASTAPFRVYCDMTRDGGGWTRAVNIEGSSGSHADQPGAVGDVSEASAPGKLADAVINDLTTIGYWRYNCGMAKNAFVRNSSGKWTSLKFNQLDWEMDNDRDGAFECRASRTGYGFADYPACPAGHSNYAAMGGPSEGYGCFVSGEGWGRSGNIWVK